MRQLYLVNHFTYLKYPMKHSTLTDLKKDILHYDQYASLGIAVER